MEVLFTLHPTTKLRICSAALASYDTVSNFGNDTTIKQNLCAAGFNKLLAQMPGATLDGLNVSKRSLRYTVFKLVDTSFRGVPLQGNRFSFSIFLRRNSYKYLRERCLNIVIHNA